MLRHRLASQWRLSQRQQRQSWHQQFTRRFESSQPQSHTQSKQASRIDRITARLPKRLQKYTQGLRNAPVSHIVSFLILHELTAIVPLFALFGLFHYTTYAPVGYMTQHFGEYVQSGVSRFEKYFKRKGWFGFQKDQDTVDAGEKVVGHQTQDVLERASSGDDKYKILVEVALAYSITKALLPLRIVGSVWATPWFAGILTRTRAAFKRKA